MAVEKLIVDHIDTWTTALQTRSTAGRGSSGKIDLYGIKKLRELILELAVRGKLVPQDPNDEPASELLKRIAAEKAELVKQGKIKKPKPLPEISEEEKPFELPVGWEWVRLEKISTRIGSGSTPKGGKNVYLETGVPFLRSQNIWNHGIKLEDIAFISSQTHNNMSNTHVMPNDILLNITGASLGRCSIFPKTISEANVNQHVTIIRLVSEDYVPFIHLAIISPVIQREIWHRQVGMAIEGLSKKSLESFIFPIPPKNEQESINKKVTELMSLCDQLEQHSLTSLDAHQQLVETLLTTLTDSQNADELAENWARISEHFDTLFNTEASIDALKQTILQLAVMGKLVPQDPNDEPASELLKRIAQEKAQLVKDGKMKKQKPLPPISDEEKPFELPDGWVWCRLNDLFSFITDGDHQAPPKSDTGIPFLVIGNLNKGIVSFDECKYVPIDYYERLDWSRKPCQGDVLYTVTGSYGIPIIVDNNEPFCVQRHVAILKSCSNTPVTYLRYLFLSKYAYAYAEKIATGIAQKTVPLTGLRLMPIPVPPNGTLLNIINLINLVDAISASLKLGIQSAKKNQLHLADALTDAAIN
ncbi:restriction endonuclease subunit S [Klebsiella michiganensis]|uniref:restriction endonuclease subunit S n=1 Tax=Klebsiella michiganensis TaxID=1134687 RepID=UPI0016501884|nr:restriction endonuclease subunit S [Klebsiella michiganensis]ELT9702241.1 restriction endonuclease subunit S [Klebsiella michiganensis]ELT9752135.1 restriction endonuclease subunit S [Klebsiella michiganensis]MBF8473268.1 restriction endonuclease subunit S [Klebsiella michiganensis]MBZ6603139.1 restriction endonuclease subunit S [Klebsiella michiganensis]QSW13931.1 restriction endonuclease subunit S [Klebsiella michiganensis]